MAITISGQNNNDKILASDGVLDSISGFNVVGVLTATTFEVNGKATTNHISIGNNIHLGNAGIITATTLIGNVTGNVNHTSNLLLQISGSEKFRVGNGGQFGIAGANYGTAGQVFTSGGSGSAPTWSTINSDKITEGNTEAEVVDTGSDGHFKVTTEGNERLRIDSSGRVMMGTTTEGRLTGDRLTIASNGHTGMTIRSGTSAGGNIFFSDGTSGDDELRGVVSYDHTNNFMRFYTNAAERLRIASSGQIGLSGENYGSSGQVLTSQGSGSAVAWTTISTDLVSDTSPQLGGDLDTNSHHILLDDLHSLKLGDNADAQIRHDGYSAVEIKYSDATTTVSTQSPPCGIRVTNTSNTTNRLNGIYFTHGSETANVGLFAKQKDNATSSAGEGSDLLIYTKQNGESIMEPRFRFTNAGHFEPENDTTHNIGSSTKKIANTYTAGLHSYATYTHTGTHGSTILNSTGAEIVLTRGARNQIYASNSSGFIDFHTGGQTTYPAIRIFATPEVTTGAKVGINTDSVGVDTQMSVMASPGKPGLYTSYGMRIMPNGANSFNYPSHYITNASGIYVIHTTIPANNTWTQVCAGRYHGATVTCRVGDASSKRTIFANYDFTAPNYGVAHYNEIANNGNWNTGSASMRVANAGTYDYALEVQHNSYYNTSNTSSVSLIFNIC